MFVRNMNRGIWCFVLMVSVIVAVASVSAIPQTINLHGRLTNSTSGDALTETYNINFSIYNAYSTGTALYSKLVSVTPASDGVYDVILDNVDLSFSEQYYLGIKVADDLEMTPRINLTSSPYAYMAQNVSVGGITYDGNVDMGANNLTTTGYGFFGFLGSLTNRITKLWVDEANVTGNVTAGGYFIGDGSLLTGIETDTGWVNDTTSTNTSLNVNIDGILNATGAATVGGRLDVIGRLYTGLRASIGNYYTSTYDLSVQSSTNDSWIEILNNGGIGKGAFFGMQYDNFELWSYQGGDIEFYTNETASTGELRMTIEAAGDVIVAENLEVGETLKTDVINSSSSGNVTITSVGGSVIVKLG